MAREIVMLGITALRNKFNKPSVLKRGPIKKIIIRLSQKKFKIKNYHQKKEAVGESPTNHNTMGGIETRRGFSSSLLCP